MSTTLFEGKDKYGQAIEIYDSSAGLTLLIDDKKLNIDNDMALEIVTALRISRNIDNANI